MYKKKFHKQKLSLNRYFIMIIKKWLVIMKLLSLSQMSKFTFTEPITQYLEY